MMCDDFGSAAPVKPYNDQPSAYQLTIENNRLKAENNRLTEELNKFKQAPIRRMMNSILAFFGVYYPLFIFVTLIGILTFGMLVADNHLEKKMLANCEFSAKINDTTFEFDKVNRKCYIFDKSLNTHIYQP